MKLKTYFKYIGLFVLEFFGFQFLIQDTSSAMFILLIATPLCVLIESIMFGYAHGKFDIFFLLILEIVFIPSVFVFMNESALIYAFVYGVLGAVGEVIGIFIGKAKKSED